MKTIQEKILDNAVDKLPDILHRFQMEFNVKDVFYNGLGPLERRAIKNKYTEIIKELFSKPINETEEKEVSCNHCGADLPPNHPLRK